MKYEIKTIVLNWITNKKREIREKFNKQYEFQKALDVSKHCSDVLEIYVRYPNKRNFIKIKP